MAPIRARTLGFRLTATTTLAAVALGAAAPAWAPAWAQGSFSPLAPPPTVVRPGDGSAMTEWRPTDPPERVGRVAMVTGKVSFHTRDADQWAPASMNYPLAAGNAFWVEPDGRAQLDISASRVALGGGTELQVTALDDTAVVLAVPQGSALVDVRQPRQNETWSVQTPRGLVNLAGAGRYAVVAGDATRPTQVTVLEGAAEITAPGAATRVEPGQTVTLTGLDTVQAELGPASVPAELAGLLPEAPVPAAVAPPPLASPSTPLAVPPPPVVAQMPGGSGLTAYGSWADSADDGPVWYPRVDPGWVPYRDGHWAYVQPWGWTWIDDAPWGFAPFHYGRWRDYDGRWGWSPGGVALVEPPVYAPALVTFFGIGAGVALGAALAAGSVGWWPLGPREPYRPWYRASPRYYQSVNRYGGWGGRPGPLNQNVTINNEVNRRAATVVPAGAMAASLPVNRHVQAFDARNQAAIRPVVGAPPIRPTAATAGITPNAAQRMALPAAPAGFPAPVRGPAPGPAIGAMPPANGAGFTRPGLQDPTRAAPGASFAGQRGPGGPPPGAPMGAPVGAPVGAPTGAPAGRQMGAPTGSPAGASMGAPFGAPPTGGQGFARPAPGMPGASGFPNAPQTPRPPALGATQTLPPQPGSPAAMPRPGQAGGAVPAAPGGATPNGLAAVPGGRTGGTGSAPTSLGTGLGTGPAGPAQPGMAAPARPTPPNAPSSGFGTGGMATPQPGATGQPNRFGAPSGPFSAPAPQGNQFHSAPPPTVQTPAPQPQFRSAQPTPYAAPPPRVQTPPMPSNVTAVPQPRPAPQFQAPAPQPQPQFRAPPPQVHAAPPPQFRAPPPQMQQPQYHAPPPQMHAAPQQQFRAPAAAPPQASSRPAPPPQQQKRPGER